MKHPYSPCSILRLVVVLGVVLLYPWNVASAKARGLGFIIDEQGEIRKVILHTRKVFTLGKGFPFTERPVAIGVTESSSERESVRIELDTRICDWISYDGYALDSNHIVVNGHDSLGRNHFVAVWDWRRNQLRIHNNVGSRSPEGISGISPDEKWAVSVPSQFSGGLILHDLERGTTFRLYDGLDVFSPRFSPDGTQWAFFSRDELILRSTIGVQEKRAAIPGNGKWKYPRHLAWSPAGRYIAGIVRHQRTDLVIWDSDGKQVTIVGVPSELTNTWPPIWSADEKGVYIVLGNEGLAGKWQQLRTQFVALGDLRQ